MYLMGFIGAGNMGGALIRAAAKSTEPGQIIIADHHADKVKYLSEITGCHIAPSNEVVAEQARYVVLGVKPGGIREVVRSLAPVLARRVAGGDRPVLVSMAAGVSTAALRECLTEELPILRIMPNMPVAVGRGMTLITGNGAEERDLEEFQTLLAAAGLFERLPESAFDDTTSISGCTPAYAFLFIEALADGAVQMGVPRDRAIRLAAQSLLGSAAMVLESGVHPGQLKDNVCSPGGSTIMGVNALEEHGFRYAAAQAIIKSTEKNRTIGK